MFDFPRLETALNFPMSDCKRFLLYLMCLGRTFVSPTCVAARDGCLRIMGPQNIFSNTLMFSGRMKDGDELLSAESASSS